MRNVVKLPVLVMFLLFSLSNVCFASKGPESSIESKVFSVKGWGKEAFNSRTLSAISDVVIVWWDFLNDHREESFVLGLRAFSDTLDMLLEEDLSSYYLIPGFLLDIFKPQPEIEHRVMKDEELLKGLTPKARAFLNVIVYSLGDENSVKKLEELGLDKKIADKINT